MGAVLLATSLQPLQLKAQTAPAANQSVNASLGEDSQNFRRSFADLQDASKSVEYSLRNMDGMMADLDHMDRLARASISERAAIELVNRLGTAIDLYVLVLQDQRIPGERKIDLTSSLEGGMYQAFVSLLRQLGADPLDPKTRTIPNRSLLRKLLHEIGVDMRAFVSAPRDAFGKSVYSPFEKLYRDQATQQVLVKLQDLAKQTHTIQDGDRGAITENSRDMLQEIVVDNSVKTVNDRRVAQWAAVGAYGLLAVASFFVIVDYVGIVDGMLGGVGRTEMSQLITGVINFSVMFSVATLKAASIRGHVRQMVLDLQTSLKNPADGKISPLRHSLATFLFRKQIDFDAQLARQGSQSLFNAGGGARLRCSQLHLSASH